MLTAAKSRMLKFQELTAYSGKNTHGLCNVAAPKHLIKTLIFHIKIQKSLASKGGVDDYVFE